MPISSQPIKSASYQYDLSLKKYFFIYLAVPGLSDDTQDLSLWYVGLGSVVKLAGLAAPLCGISVP